MAERPRGLETYRAKESLVMYDPNLHLFLDDSEITVRQDLYRMIHPVRRESLEPVLAPDPKEEWLRFPPKRGPVMVPGTNMRHSERLMLSDLDDVSMRCRWSQFSV